MTIGLRSNINMWVEANTSGGNTDTEIIRTYTLDKDIALAQMHDKYANMLYSRIRSYNCFDEAEKQSLLFECIYTALENYTTEHGANFRTYLTVVTDNKFRSASNYVFAKSKGRNWYLEAVYVDGAEDDESNQMNALSNLPSHEDVFGNIEILDSTFLLSLSNNQYRYLQLILESKYETVSDGQAAKALELTRSGIARIRESIAGKLIVNNLV